MWQSLLCAELGQHRFAVAAFQTPWSCFLSASVLILLPVPPSLSSSITCFLQPSVCVSIWAWLLHLQSPWIAPWTSKPFLTHCPQLLCLKGFCSPTSFLPPSPSLSLTLPSSSFPLLSFSPPPFLLPSFLLLVSPGLSNMNSVPSGPPCRVHLSGGLPHHDPLSHTCPVPLPERPPHLQVSWVSVPLGPVAALGPRLGASQFLAGFFCLSSLPTPALAGLLLGQQWGVMAHSCLWLPAGETFTNAERPSSPAWLIPNTQSNLTSQDLLGRCYVPRGVHPLQGPLVLLRKY